ncbi:677_t:CDS:10 [Diversispora eburnea]|uniref:677_t:CDS:1 n=1 Tax=Diversispora eburnea TaxID=1213867 RepID=A0A9N9FIN8_9GLOM|nr:677_t:CDS:10 [Diversispora eburnea]
MSLYGDLPPPTHSESNADEETQQPSTSSETQTTSSKTSKSALPVGWTPGTLRFMPTIQRKPIIQAKPKLIPRIPASISPNKNYISNSPNLSTAVSSPPQPFPSESGPIVQTSTSTTTTSPKPSMASEELNEFKPLYSSQRIRIKRQAPLSYDDDYDPTRPNDYEEFKEFEKKRREKEAIMRQEEMRPRSMRSYPPPPLYSELSPSSSKASEASADVPTARSPPVKLDLEISGEEAFLRRARLSNRAVNETTPKSPEIKATTISSSSGEDFAHRMLTKYGWQEGQGLGKNEQGINEPLTVQKTDKRSGYIVNTSSTHTAKTEQPPSKLIPNYEVPSKVIMLTNMVGPGEVDDTLQEETADECKEKYGAVEIRIFVKFVDQIAAIKAKKDLNGRFFGGRAVSARFFDEVRYEKLDLAPSAVELQMGKPKES